MTTLVCGTHNVGGIVHFSGGLKTFSMSVLTSLVQRQFTRIKRYCFDGRSGSAICRKRLGTLGWFKFTWLWYQPARALTDAGGFYSNFVEVVSFCALGLSGWDQQVSIC